MAKIGKHVQGRWSKQVAATSEHRAWRKEYALRADSVLLRKTTHLNDNGTVWFSDGWKRVGKQTLGYINRSLGNDWARS